jgi:hypothetical protein
LRKGSPASQALVRRAHMTRPPSSAAARKAALRAWKTSSSFPETSEWVGKTR